MATIAAFLKVTLLQQKPGYLLILNLACADLGIGLVEIFHFPQLALKMWPYGKSGCMLINFMINLFLTAGLVTIVAISMDRFLLLSREYPKYLRIQSRKRIICIIGGIWLYGILMGIVDVLFWDKLTPPGFHDYFDFSKNCRSPPNHNLVFALVKFFTQMIGPLLAVESFSVAFFVRLIRKLRQPMVHPMSNTSMASQNPSSSRSAAGPSGSSTGPMAHGAAIPRPDADPNKRYKKAAIVLGAIVLVVNICTLPFVLYAFITPFCTQCNKAYHRDQLAYVMYLNSCINPFLYAATMIKIRKFYKRVLCNSR
ncbi:beta-3 adrenergic receptor-like [Amphiura filiformis]|uniref:beta-3 adrenergic receptor-like n=1 Tax=Amphiura filiformis TaxID=82378 RepID=UPI003B21B7D4